MNGNQWQNDILRIFDLGVVRLPLKEISVFSQIGTNLTEDEPLVVLVQGKRNDGNLSTFLITISIDNTASSLLSLDAKEITENFAAEIKNNDLKSVHYCSRTR